MHEPLLNHAKAAKVLHDLNPFTSLAIPHAAIAGVCLFLSGLLAGYFDNMAVYRKVGPRLKAHPRLKTIMGQERLDKFAGYIERNLGALAGNFIGLIIVSFLGVLAIGLTNLFVSFTLTIIVALRARRVRFEQWKPLAKLVLTHFLTRPSDFFWPPKVPLEVDESSNNTKHHTK